MRKGVNIKVSWLLVRRYVKKIPKDFFILYFYILFYFIETNKHNKHNKHNITTYT
jgi:hypothetical protein